jgi:hypothetical protein
MKKGLMMIMLVMISAITFAQSHRGGQRRHGDGQIEKMKTDLELSDTQYATIKEINKKYAAKHNALRGDSAAQSGKHIALNALRQEKDKEIQGVLTPEQKTKWETFKAQRTEARKAKSKERLEKHEAKMKLELSLSEEQFAKMQAVNKTFREKVMQLKAQSPNENFRGNSEFQQIKNEHDVAIKTILSEDQFKKWSDLKRSRKNSHHKRHRHE